MRNVVLLFATVTAFAILSSCQKNYSGEVDNITLDPDAELFITNAKIGDAVQQEAINNFVLELKKDSLWKKFGAIYPMVGGTSFSTKWNLKDPRDLDEAYRITWNGAPVFASTGVTCLTVNDWGDTHLIDTTLSYINSSMSFYSGTQNKVAGYDMGCSNDIVPYNIMAIYEDWNLDVVNTWFNRYGTAQYQPAVTTGLFTVSSVPNMVSRYDNGVLIANYKFPIIGHTEKAITIGKILDDSRMGLRECRLAAIGEGLTDATALQFYNVVKKYESSLSR